MTFKTLIKTAVAATALVVASVASAATPLTFNSGIAIFSDVFASATPFTDDFSFDIPAGSDGKATVSAIAGFTDFTPNVTFTNALIYKSGDATKANLASLILPAPFAVGLKTPSLSAGTYILEFVGFAQAEGSYAGQLKLVTAPVPEPETYAMFLAGLGLMGAIARRRKNA